VAAVLGDQQAGAAGYSLDEPLVVEVTAADGTPVAGATIHWETQDPTAALSPSSSVTGAAGRAQAHWRLGYVEGEQHASARVGTLPGAHFTAGAQGLPLVGVAGDSLHQCGFGVDGILRCWTGPTIAPRVSSPLSTTDRFQALDFTPGNWCASAITGKLVCFNEADLTRTGSFRPELVAPGLVTGFAPAFAAMAAAVPGEVPPAGPASREPGTEDATAHCGLTETGALWCWGNNALGHMGDGTKGGFTELPAPVPGNHRFIAFDVGPWSVCAVDDGGQAWCWGQNRELVLGQPADVTEFLVPTPVATSFRFFDIAISRNNTVCALATDGEAVCWGSAWEGGLGRVGTSAPDGTPTPVNSFVRLIAIRHTGRGFAGIDLDGKLTVWGGSATAPANAVPTFLEGQNRFTRFMQGGGPDLACLRPIFGGTRCARIRELVGGGAEPLFFGVPGS
jgi:hypothetical protein